jgi:hypothetical protein
MNAPYGSNPSAANSKNHQPPKQKTAPGVKSGCGKETNDYSEFSLLNQPGSNYFSRASLSRPACAASD